MDPDALDRVADAIEAIEANIDRLREFHDVSREEFLANEETRAVVERTFVRLVAAMVDAGRVVVRQETGAAPENRKAVIEELVERDVIDDGLAVKLKDAIGFRDVLAHTYGPIIDDAIVYETLQRDHERFVRFAAAIRAYVSEIETDR